MRAWAIFVDFNSVRDYESVVDVSGCHLMSTLKPSNSEGIGRVWEELL